MFTICSNAGKEKESERIVKPDTVTSAYAVFMDKFKIAAVSGVGTVLTWGKIF